MDWIESSEAARLLGVDEAALFDGRVGPVILNVVGGSLKVLRSSLPAAAPEAIPQPIDFCPPSPPVVSIDRDFRAAYNRAPKYNKAAFDRYYPIANACSTLPYNEVKDYVAAYNADHPDAPVSPQTVYRKCQLLREGGKAALLGNYGKRRGLSDVPDYLYEIFKGAYMDNPGITFSRAYRNSIGLAILAGYSADDFPTESAFVRRFRNDVPKAAETLARKGKSKYNSSHAPHLTRDLSNIPVGACWVSDHVQLDTMCHVPWLKKATRPWLTSWMDIRSGRLIGWHLNAIPPDADCIFAAFVHAAGTNNCGIPRVCLTDNGADYKSKDLSGHKSLSLAAELDIAFRRPDPYTPQAKPIERLQRELNEGFSVLCRGYCGPNATKKPETLNEAIKAGNIETFEEIEASLAEYINGVLNTRVLTSGPLKGKSPDMVWREGFPMAVEAGAIRRVRDEDLSLFCWRASRPCTVRQGAVLDSETGQRYVADRLYEYDRRKVLLYRDIRAMDVAHVYDAVTEEFLCEARMRFNVAFFAEGADEQARLSAEIAQNTRINNAVKEAATPSLVLSQIEMVSHLKAFNAVASNDPGTELPNVRTANAPLMLTSKSGIKKKIEEQEQEGIIDVDEYSRVNDALSPPRKMPSFASDYERELYEATLAGVG